MAVLFMCAKVGFAQKYLNTNDPQKDEIKSLLKKGNEMNGFGGVDLKLAELLGEKVLITGGYGGVVADRKYLLGVAVHGIATKVPFEGIVPTREDPKNLNLQGGYGGLLIGATIAPKEVIHLSFPIVIGAGALHVIDEDFFESNPSDSEFTVENSLFFVMEPGAQLEFNITAYFRFGAGFSYRYATGTDLINVADDHISGVTALLSFRFGRF